MGLALAAVGAVGAITSSIGAAQSGSANAAMEQYQSQVAANNAKVAQQNAAWSIQAGNVQAANSGMQTKAQIGSQKAAQGASNVDVNTGSAAAVRAGTQEIGQDNALTIRSNAAKQAYGYEAQATSDTAQSQLDVMAGQQAQTAGDIGAASSLLSGASTVGTNYLRFQNSGVTGGV